MPIFRTFNLLVALMLFIPAAYAENVAKKDEQAQSSLPLNSGIQALADGKYVEADRWFALTAKDFPKKADGLRALLLQMVYRGARELSFVRVARYLNNRAELELKDKDRWTAQSQANEQEALKWGRRMYERSRLFIKRDDSRPLNLEFNFSLEGLEIDKLRSRLARGEFLDRSEMAQLERGEWLRNYVGFLREVLEPKQGEIDFSGRYSGTVKHSSLYRAFGIRLFIIGTKTKDKKHFGLARMYFKRVLVLTDDRPYDHDRQQALDFLARLDDLAARKSKEKKNVAKKKSKKSKKVKKKKSTKKTNKK